MLGDPDEWAMLARRARLDVITLKESSVVASGKAPAGGTMMPAKPAVISEEPLILADEDTYSLAGTYPTIVVCCSVAPPVNGSNVRACRAESIRQGTLSSDAGRWGSLDAESLQKIS